MIIIDALKLLVKYKPTSLNDMANISGIEDNFIDNYDTFFYKKLKKLLNI